MAMVKEQFGWVVDRFRILLLMTSSGFGTWKVTRFI